MLRKSIALAAALGLSLAAVPAAAKQESSANRLSVKSSHVVRSAAAHHDASKIGGGSVIISLIAIIAVGVGIAIAVKPKSP